MTRNTEPAGAWIVVGVDGTAASLTAVRFAAQEALLHEASVHLVLVHKESIRAAYSGPSKVPYLDEDDPDERVVLAAAEQEAARTLPPARLSSERAAGSPAKVLIARSADAEMLVLAAADPAGQSGTGVPSSMGPVARACLRSAACPVVVASSI